VEDEELPRRRGPWRQAARRFARRRLGVASLAVLLLLALVGLLAPVLAPYDVGRLFIELIQKPQPPLTAHHLLGTDVLSHDFLTQLLYAIRQTTGSAFICAGLSTVIGVVVGALSGYYGGWFGAFTSWASAVVAAVPALVVLIIVSIWTRFPVTPVGYALWLTPVHRSGVSHRA